MLGENIKKYRKEQNLSQDELAEKLNVTRQSISLWENGQTQPSLDNIIALSRLFHISTDALLTNEVDLPETDTPVPEKPKHKKRAVVLACVFSGLAVLIAAAVVIWALADFPSIPSMLGMEESAPSVSEVSSDAPKTVKTTATAKKTSAKKQVNTVQPKTQAAAKPAQSTVAPTKAPQSTAKKDVFSLLKNFVVYNGRLNGDYCAFSKPAVNYGGFEEESFSLYYWGDTDKVEFCLHSTVDEIYAINYYIYVPKTINGTYEYVTSYYYRGTGASLFEARGKIEAKDFTDKYPLFCSKYIGDTTMQDDFMEMSRIGISNAIKCMKKFLETEKTGCAFSDLGFVHF